jgi:hypothetical protein
MLRRKPVCTALRQSVKRLRSKTRTSFKNGCRSQVIPNEVPSPLWFSATALLHSRISRNQPSNVFTTVGRFAPVGIQKSVASAGQSLAAVKGSDPEVRQFRQRSTQRSKNEEDYSHSS